MSGFPLKFCVKKIIMLYKSYKTSDLMLDKCITGNTENHLFFQNHHSKVDIWLMNAMKYYIFISKWYIGPISVNEIWNSKTFISKVSFPS